MTTPVTCERFDEHADDLALGLVDEPERSLLLEHAAHCHRCRSLLDELGTVVDRLVLAAPEHEPPAGFETRVLERLGHHADLRPRAPRRAALALLAVAAALFVVGAVSTVQWAGRGSGTRTADIVAAADSSVIGEARLLATPVPYVLVTVDHPRPGSGLRHCELQLPDGTWVRVGSWEVADLAGGAWAAGIDPALLAASEMRVVTDDGTVLATARF